MSIKHNCLIFKMALPGLVLTVRTTALREEKWARTLAANGIRFRCIPSIAEGLGTNDHDFIVLEQ